MASGVAVTTMTVPAQPGFLAIYNPSLGATDETLYDQIVYYSSVAAITTAVKAGPGSRARAASSCVTHEERNERLRQIGLAQGMVEFGRSFSGHQPVGTIETEKSRVVLHEVEPGWWILAVGATSRCRLCRSRVRAPWLTPRGPSRSISHATRARRRTRRAR